MYAALDRIRIVLVNTSHPGNIGATARAMKTMGLSRLYLVQPSDYRLSEEAVSRASGGAEVLASARICSSLDEALQDCVLAVGTTARLRRVEWPCITPAECAQTLLQYGDKSEVALVFGRERSGLTNDELDRCQFMTAISANPEYSSLNLAAAVQVYGHELRQALERGSPQDHQHKANVVDESPASSEVMAAFYLHLEQTLDDIGVTEDGRPKQTLLRRLRRLFNRSALTLTEVNILRGIWTAAQGRKQNRRNGG